MKEYEFTLKFSLQDTSADPETYIEALGEAGCTDALIGIGVNGRIALDFIREAKTAFEAIFSAIEDVRRAIPGAKLVEATPDLVGLTDVAEILGLSRQYMRKLMLASGSEFPLPVHDGKSSMWHLFPVLSWLKNQYQIDESLVEVAKATMQVNVVKEAAYNIDSQVKAELQNLFT